MSPTLRLALRFGLVAAVGLLLWLFVRGIAWGQLVDALAAARLWPFAPGIALGFVMLWCHAVAVRTLLAPRHAVPARRLFRYTIAAYAASVIAPMRAGELVRFWLLKQREGVPVADSAAAVVGEKVVEAMAMMLFVAPLPLLLPDVPAWVTHAIGIGALVALGLFGVVYAVVGRVAARAGADQGWLARFLAGMHALRSPDRLWRVVAVLLAAWVADLAVVSLVLYAVGIALPIAAGILILFTLNLTIMVPTPGNVGSLEVGVIAATRLLGVADERALAFALLYHATFVVPTLVAGLALGARGAMTSSRESASAEESPAA